jgi:hypothetical protein
MTVNEGTIDRVLRIVVGAALILWFFLDSATGVGHWIKLVGIVPLLTGALGWCPIYSMLGVSTCPRR